MPLRRSCDWASQAEKAGGGGESWTLKVEDSKVQLSISLDLVTCKGGGPAKTP